MILPRAGIIFVLMAALSSCGHDAGRAKRAALQKGQKLYQAGEYDSAEIQFRKALQEDPRWGDAYFWLGRTEKQRGNYAAAFDGLKRAVALLRDQNAPKVELVNLMLVAYLGDPGRPAALYDQISRMSEDLIAKNKDAFEGIRIKGYLAMVDASPAKAIEYFEKANRIKPDEADVVTALVESLLLDNQARRAEEMAHRFLQSEPACGPLYTVLYQYYFQASRLGDAEAILKSKVAHNPKVSLYRIELARHYARVSKAQEMSETLSELLTHPKDFPNAHLDVGDFYAGRRNWIEARRQYELGSQSDPHSQVTYWKRLVQVHLATNDRPAARQLLEQILKAQPNDGDAKASRAALRMASNDPEQKKLAAAEFKTLVNEFPESADYRSQYAEALRFTGDVDGAQAQYLAVLQRQPKNLAALQELADINIRKQRLDEALGFADRALAIDRSSVRAQLVRSAALASKKRFAETRSVLTDLLKQHPDLHEAHLQLALLDVEEKHYPEAEKRFRQYYKPGQGDVRALEGLVELYRAQNQIGKAITLLQQDLEKNPQSNEVRALLANVAEQAGQHDLAVTQYEQLARAQADSPALALRLGLAYQAKHDLARAVAEFERARKLAPQNALVHAYLGKALEDSGRKPEAVAIYRQSLSLDNHNPWVMNNLAYLLADTGGDLNQALRLAQEAERQQPNEASFTDTVGWVYLKKGDIASAMHVFEAVREKSPRNVTFRIHLAMTLLASGNPARGRLELISAQQFPCTPEERVQIAELFTRSGLRQ